MGWGGSSSTSHMSLQLSSTDGKHGGRSSSTSHMSLQLSTADGIKGMGLPPHHTCHFNSQLLMANGGVDGSSSTSHVSLQLSTTDGQHGGRSSSTSHMSLQLSTADGIKGMGLPPHHTCHFNSQLLMANRAWVLLHITHVTSTLIC